jgi:biopolymer transport protein ExbB/TolQ
MSGIAQFFIEGGIWMAPIALLSVLVMAVAIERCYYLFVVQAGSAKDLSVAIRKAVQAGQIDQAIKACDAQPKLAVAQVLRRGLENADASGDEIRVGFEEANMDIVPQVQKRSHTLAGLASLATLLGLLGTVMGLIEAFTVVADAPPDQKSVLLTKAISVAMNCTAFGLMVAIPAMFFQLLLNGSVKRILDDIDNLSLRLENQLVARAERAHVKK